MTALDADRAARSGADNVEISVGYVGVDPVELPDQRHLPVDRRAGGGACSGWPSSAGRASTSRRSRSGSARSSPSEMPGRAVLVRAGRHRQRGHELRLADAGRGRRQRPEPRRRTGPTPRRSASELAKIPSLRDLQYRPVARLPDGRASTIDRERAGLSGVTAEEVARSLVAATSSSRFVVPNYWPDPKTGIGYQVQVEIPLPADELGRARSRRSRSSSTGGAAAAAPRRRRASRRARCRASTTATT